MNRALYGGSLEITLTVPLRFTFLSSCISGFNELICCSILLGELVEWVNWGMGQPTGLDQHCMYIVGGQHGYQWADFHCGFQVSPPSVPTHVHSKLFLLEANYFY